MKCFYHNDLDGQASAYCVREAFDIIVINQDTSYISMDYNKEFPLETILPDEQIWIVDFSISPEIMEKLLLITKDIIWIDHHKTAIEKYVNFPHDIRGLRRDGEAACVLTWKYIRTCTKMISNGRYSRWQINDKKYEDLSEDPIPRSILLTGDRDTWTWKYGDETKYFYAGSQIHDTSPESDFWKYCNNSLFWEKLLEDGELIERFKAKHYEDYATDLGYEVMWQGHKCFALNVAKISSDVLGNRIELYDILLPHYHNGKQWMVSLYSDKVDVSEIAKQLGGGGHKGAAGFPCSSLPWLSE